MLVAAFAAGIALKSLDHAYDALQSGRPAPIVDADLVSAIHAARPGAEPLADMLIAALLKWDCAVPLLMAERYGPAFKTSGAGAACARGAGLYLGYLPFPHREATGAALRTAGEIVRRAETLPPPSSRPCSSLPRRPATISRVGRQPGCSTGWRVLAPCANCRVGARSGAMGYDDG